MKTKLFTSNLSLATLWVAAITLWATTCSFAAGPYYWDGNDNAAGFGTASGTWAVPTIGTTTSGWSTDSTGATTVNGNSVTTGTADALNFGTGTASYGLAAGTITLSGTVNASTLTFGAQSGAIILSGGTINLGGTTITPNNAGDTINSAISLNANTTFYSPLSAGSLTLGGAISGSFNVVFGGLNTGAAAVNVVLNAQSAYTGTTTISTAASSAANNIVQLGIDNALPTSTALTVTGNNGSSTSTRWSRLDLNGHDQTVASIVAGGTLYRQFGIINSSGTLGTLTVSNASDNTFIGQIGYYGGAFSGNNGSLSYLGLTKTGAGKLTLNPARYYLYYTGPTTVNQGVLEIAGTAQLANGNSYPGAISIAGGATLLFSGTAANPLGGAISGSGNLTNSGTGTVTLEDANTSFAGSISVSGTNISGNATLALGASGNIGGCTNLAIGTNGTFDVSAQATFTLGSSATLKASGTGTAAATQAAIKGGTTVSLGARPITLAWGGASVGTDDTHPCLVVSQGTLTLNNNPFTINGSLLAVGAYRLIQVGDGSTGTINQSGSPSYAVSGTAIDGTKNNVISVNSGNVILTVSSGSASTNAFLKSLVLNPAGTLTPAFATNVFSYAASEPPGDAPTLTVTNADPAAIAKLIFNGGTPVTLTSGVASSPVTLTAGLTNTIVVQVTAGNGLTTYNYNVSIYVPSAGAYYWDGNGTIGGFGTAGGTWADPTIGSASQGWSTNSAGTVIPGNVSTGTNDTLNYGSVVGATTNVLDGGAITVSGTVNAGKLVFGALNNGIVLGGSGTINLADNATIAFDGRSDLNATFANAAVQQVNGPVLTGAGTSLLITNGGGLLLKSLGTAGWGAGATATIAGNSEVSFYTSAGNALGGSGGYSIALGAETTGGGIQTANSTSIPNNVVVTPGSGFRFISLYGNNGTPGYVGNITAHTNLYIVFGSSGTYGKTALVSGSDSVDSGATVTYAMGAAIGDYLRDTAIWDGLGSVAYTSAALTNVSRAFINVVSSSSAYFLISGAKTYSGGASVYGFTNGSYAVVSGSSDTTPPNNGPFGTGTLTLGPAAFLRANTGAAGDSTLGNAVALAGDVTFPTVASENSITFQGNVNLGSGTRTITCNVGTTDPSKWVDFQGVISGIGSAGLVKAGTGWLKLSGANTYTGNTTITGGTLDIAQAFLATNATISISNNAVLNLEFGGVNVVAGFITNGVSLPPGVYGSADVAPFITGSGSLQVVVSGPSGAGTLTNSISGSTLSLSWPAGQGWRLQQQTNALSKGLSTNWVYVTDGSVSSTNMTVNPAQPTMFYRLTYP